MLGEVPSKTATWVLTTVKAGTDKGLEDPYISLVGGWKADKCCWQGEQHVQEGRCTRPILREKIISSVPRVQSLGFQWPFAETHRERMLFFVQTISTSGELSEGPGGCSLGLYLGFLPQDSEVHWGTTWRLPDN